MNTQETAESADKDFVQESFVVVLDPAKTKTPFAAFCANKEDADAVAAQSFNVALGARVVKFRGPIEVIIENFELKTMVVNMDLHCEGEA